MIAYINGIQRRTHGERDEREKEAGEETRLREKLKLIRNCTLLGTKAKKGIETLLQMLTKNTT